MLHYLSIEMLSDLVMHSLFVCRSRSYERLRSRSPVMGRKLTFKEQMRKEFINASKVMAKENGEFVCICFY